MCMLLGPFNRNGQPKPAAHSTSFNSNKRGYKKRATQATPGANRPISN